MNYEQLLNCNVRAELARRNFSEFVKYVKPGYEMNWHHALLCKYLQKFIEGGIKRLMVFMPPQHGKSELVSRQLPSYLLGINPAAKIVLASYSAHLSSSFNRECQRIIDSDAYHEVFPETILNCSNVVTKTDNYLRNSEIFETVGYGGFLKTVGVGGSLTGTPADYAIIDDPVKDSIEAMSPTYQQRNWDWFNDVLYTRIHNSSSILITQTRWDVNDLSGKLIQKINEGIGEKWVVLSLPGIKTSETNPEDIRSIGEALWPSRHSLEKLQEVRARSLRTFESLYQQDPKPVMSGGEFWRSFDPGKHVKGIEVGKTTLHVTIDNNVTPYVTVAIWQIAEKCLHQVFELPCTAPDNNAPRAARKLAKWLNSIDYKDVLFIYGDPSASARSTIDENNASFFDKFIDEVRSFGFKVTSRVGKSAPQIALSAAFINEIYADNYGGYSIAISNKCPVSIEDYYTVKEDHDGTMKKVKKKNPETGITYEPYGHFSDAKRYFITTILKNEFIQYQSRSRKTRSIAIPQ